MVLVFNLIILFIIILILFNDNTNIDNFINTNNKYVCMYAYYEKKMMNIKKI